MLAQNFHLSISNRPEAFLLLVVTILFLKLANRRYGTGVALIGALGLFLGLAFVIPRMQVAVSPHHAQVSDHDAPPVGPPRSAAGGDLQLDDAPPLVEAPESPSPASDARRPAWTEEGPKLENGVYRTVAFTDWWTPIELEPHRKAALAEAIERYVDRRLGSEAATKIVVPESLVQRILSSEYTEQQKKEIAGEEVVLQRVFLRLEFDDRTRQELKALWDRVVVQQRVKTVGSGFVLVLAGLGIAWSLLRVRQPHRTHA